MLEEPLPSVGTMAPEILVPQDDGRKYWCADPDPRALASKIAEKIEKYYDYLRRTRLYNRIRRNWRYYHNLFYSEDDALRDIRSLGEEGEYAGLSVNHHRNLIQHLLTLATQNPPVVDVLAVNSSMKALSQAQLGRQLLDYYYQVKRACDVYKRAVENALVFSAGYVKTVWNPRKGKDVQLNPFTGKSEKDGDLEDSTPGFFDVLYDWHQPDWNEQRWCSVRKLYNKWELAELYPENRNLILEYKEDAYDFNNFLRLETADDDDDVDLIPVWEFYHKATDAVPEGRMALCLGDETLEDGPMVYDELPIDRVVTGEFLGTCHGYTPGFDLQGLQEAMNGEFSSILTNHESFGVQALWAPTASNVNAEEIRKHLLLIHSDQEPKALNFTSTPPEIFQMIAVIVMHMEYISGVNSVLRGQPEASLKSGRALALIAAQAIQFASPLIQSTTGLIESNGTKKLHILRDFATTPRIVALAGKSNAGLIKHFQGSDLDLVDQVKVQLGNAMSRTLAGRVEMADKLADRGWLRNRDEYYTVLTTGQLEPLLASEEAQLRVVHEEAEQLMGGGTHKASILDYHVMHIKEHHAILNSTETRMDPMLSSSVLAAVMEHMEFLWDPMVQQLQATLGYETVIPPMPNMAGTGLEKTAETMGVGRPEAPRNPNRDMAMPEGSPEAQAAQFPQAPEAMGVR